MDEALATKEAQDLYQVSVVGRFVIKPLVTINMEYRPT